MNPYLVTHQQAQTLVGAGVNIECVPTQEIDGISYVDLRDINTYITDKKIKYNFSKVHSDSAKSLFCTSRSLENTGLNVIYLFCGAGGSSTGFR